jgi:hypothetical protein
MCCVNSCKANYRHSTVFTIIIIIIIMIIIIKVKISLCTGRGDP